MAFMRNVLKTGGRWLRTGWVLPLALLALPNCLLDSGPYQGGGETILPFDPGESPTDAVMCAIPKMLMEGESDCANPQEAMEGMPMEEAALALLAGQSNPIALDWSQSAIDECGGPKKVEYFGTFPDGLPVCLNCELQIPTIYADRAAVCIAKCEDLLHNHELPFPTHEDVITFCAKNAKVATNFANDTCYLGECENGLLKMNFVDPRRTPEPVKWVDHIGTDDNMGTNSLTRNVPGTGTETIDFNAGAASAQTIARGDAWVEFEALDSTDKAHVLGVRPSFDANGQKCFDVINCPDTDPSLNNIGFAIALNTDGMVYVFEVIDGALTGQGPFPAFAAGERYRVNVKDNHDGTATITYSREESGVFNQFAESLTHPEYPLRVDTSFREHGAIIENATIVRIQK